MARRVIRDTVRERRADVLDTELVDEQLGELEHAWRERRDIARQAGVAGRVVSLKQ